MHMFLCRLQCAIEGDHECDAVIAIRGLDGSRSRNGTSSWDVWSCAGQAVFQIMSCLSKLNGISVTLRTAAADAPMPRTPTGVETPQTRTVGARIRRTPTGAEIPRTLTGAAVPLWMRAKRADALIPPTTIGVETPQTRTVGAPIRRTPTAGEIPRTRTGAGAHQM